MSDKYSGYDRIYGRATAVQGGMASFYIGWG